MGQMVWVGRANSKGELTLRWRRHVVSEEMEEFEGPIDTLEYTNELPEAYAIISTSRKTVLEKIEEHAKAMMGPNDAGRVSAHQTGTVHPKKKSAGRH